MVGNSWRESASASAHADYALCSERRLFAHESLSHSDLHAVVELEHSERNRAGPHVGIGELSGNRGKATSVGVVAESCDLHCVLSRCRWQLFPGWPGRQ